MAGFLGYDCKMPKPTHGGARPRSGPKREDKSTPLETTFLVPMSNAQKEKVKGMGGAVWVRKQIDAAEPTGVPNEGSRKKTGSS